MEYFQPKWKCVLCLLARNCWAGIRHVQVLIDGEVTLVISLILLLRHESAATLIVVSIAARVPMPGRRAFLRVVDSHSVTIVGPPAPAA